MIESIPRMANQIAAFFATQPGQDQAERMAAHLNDFWAPAMRADLAARLKDTPEAFAPLVGEAARHLRLP